MINDDEYRDWLNNILIRDRKNKSIESGADVLFSLNEQYDDVPPILIISAYLIKLQLLEYEMKRLIIILDDSLKNQLNKSKSVVKMIPKDKKIVENYTLRRAIEQLVLYDNDIINSIKPRLEGVNTSRNNFVHKLFLSKTQAETLAKEALSKRDDVEFVINELRRLEKSLYPNVIDRVDGK